MSDNVAAHQKAVAQFTMEAKDGQNAALKAFVAEMLPTLEGHLAHAEKLEADLK